MECELLASELSKSFRNFEFLLEIFKEIKSSSEKNFDIISWRGTTLLNFKNKALKFERKRGVKNARSNNSISFS